MRFFNPLLFFTLTLFSHPIKVPSEEYYHGFPSFESHPGHFPLISHITFRNICNHIIDQSTKFFDPDLVKKGDLIYLNGWYLDWFSEHVHFQIKEPYILITADVGSWFPPKRFSHLLYDKKLAAWFCRNMLFHSHPKLFQIPMGQDPIFFDHSSEDLFYIFELTQKTTHKKHLLYLNHYPRNQGGRKELYEQFQKKDFCFSHPFKDGKYSSTPVRTYYEDLFKSSYVLSPIGLETDCVRTWEAISLGCIPIVEHSFLDSLYADLPILIIDDWKEITEDFLREKESLLKAKSKEQAYFPYWEKKIGEIQTEVKKGENHFSSLSETFFSEKDMRDLSQILEGINTLIYKGFLSSFRPIQIAKELPHLTSIYMYDPWFTPSIFFSFQEELPPSFTSALWKFRFKCNGMDNLCYRSEIQNHPTLSKGGQSAAIFLDLTYFHHSLLTDLKDLRNEPWGENLLKRDLLLLYENAPLFTLICGNKLQSPYVKKAIKHLVDVNQTSVSTLGNFWFIYKNTMSLENF